MKPRSAHYRIEAKRQAVVARMKEAMSSIDTLSGMWEEDKLDALILAFGIGHVILNDSDK